MILLQKSLNAWSSLYTSPGEKMSKALYYLRLKTQHMSMEATENAIHSYKVQTDIFYNWELAYKKEYTGLCPDCKHCSDFM